MAADPKAHLLDLCEAAWLAQCDVPPDDFPEQLRYPLWKLGLALDELYPGRLMDRLSNLVDERGGIPLSQITRPGESDG